MPRPFIDQSFEFTQPDGSTIRLTGSGNQFSAIFEDDQGFVVMRDPSSGYYVYGRLNGTQSDFEPTAAVAGRDSPQAAGLQPHLRPRPGSRARAMSFEAERGPVTLTRWQQRIAERRAQQRAAAEAAGRGLSFAPPSQETTGTFVGLCLLIAFPDVPATIAASEVDDFCNLVGYTGFGNNGSVHDYFLDVSHGRFRYTNLVTAYYTAQNPRSHYTDETIPDGQRARELILERLANLASSGFDFTPLTTDAQGFIRALNVYYVGPRVNNWSKGLWPHAWHLAAPVTVAPGKAFFDYQFTNMGDELTLGTFCHENGHMICDFPDLYDYAADSFRSNGIGDYCLMCAGGRDDKNPVRVSAYLNRLAGWAHSVMPTSPGMQGSLAADRDDFLIHPKSSEEYFLIENRVRAGRDAELPTEGGCVWHCAHDGANEHQDGTPTLHYECALTQADGERHLERGINLGDAGDLFHAGTQAEFGDGTLPNSRWWDGTPSGLELRDIGPAGGDLTFAIPGGDGAVVVASTPALPIPDNDALGIADSLAVAETGIIGSISVSVDIAHSFRGDLVVRLRGPSGATAVLHDRQGGSADDLRETFSAGGTDALGIFLGSQMAGTWRLEVADRAPIDTGRLNGWTLTLGRPAAVQAEIAESPGVMIPNNDPAGIVRTLASAGPGTVGTISVSVDITHSFIRDLRVRLVSPQGTAVTLHNREGGSADNILRTYTEATTPSLAQLRGQPLAGDWRLEIAGLEGLNVGKLNHWAVRFNGPAIA
jgi:M6 family metalloprotease-like protein